MDSEKAANAKARLIETGNWRPLAFSASSRPLYGMPRARTETQTMPERPPLTRRATRARAHTHTTPHNARTYSHVAIIKMIRRACGPRPLSRRSFGNQISDLGTTVVLRVAFSARCSLHRAKCGRVWAGRRPLCERPIRYNKCSRAQQHADARAPAARRHYGDIWRRWAHRCRMRGGRTKRIRQQTTHGGSLQLPSSARCKSDVLILAGLPRRYESRECGRHRGLLYTIGPQSLRRMSTALTLRERG